MADVARAKTQPTRAELRERIVAAIETFIAERRRDEWMSGFSSHEYRLLIDAEYKVWIAKAAAPSTTLYVFSDPLESLRIDPWAVGLRGGVKEAALDSAAESVVRKLERGKWWVP